MEHEHSARGPVLRLFEVRTKQGRARELLSSFATTSADVVRNEPGNRGYFFGRSVAANGDDTVIFSSLWEDLDAIKKRFGESWQDSYLPPGYEELIEACSVRHFDLSAGWHVVD